MAVGILAEKYHKLPSEIVDPEGELSPIARLMLDGEVSVRTDRWLKRKMKTKGEAEQEPVSVKDQIKAEWKAWQTLK